jgi:hypothetical protein
VGFLKVVVLKLSKMWLSEEGKSGGNRIGKN